MLLKGAVRRKQVSKKQCVAERCQGESTRSVPVAYLLSAGNISTPLPSRLGGPHQLVIHLRNGLSRPHAPCCPDRKHTCHALHHGHPIRLPLTPPNVVATVARYKAALLAASTHGRSSRPPSLAYTAATAWPGPGHSWAREPATAGASSHGAARNCDRHGTRPADAACRLRPCTAC